ncbi:MAG TPA: RIP metalloprotease RseP [Candidatus Pullilachnospira stercoravium]|uniref:Zinc metalloprotease n=1 Tax=Candidatus Pullilachnospira stercoravium TaxID=2840913 RepID=A0A9D1NUE7_9FIRM|nr:RIP metalloprotease RseP [Candidatus Pullilachnospira stercoravium]
MDRKQVEALSIIIAFLILGIVIIVHELGHFVAAKLNGIMVEEFSVGMGPRIISTQRGETLYSLRVVPFGGSCMMKGEDEDDTAEGSFNSKSVWRRIAVIAAGPLFNFILAFFGALVIISIVGYDPPRILQVKEDSAAWEAGLREGDILTEFDGHTIDFGRDMSLYEQLYGLDGDVITLSFLRDGQEHTISYQPDVEHRYLLGISYYQTEEQAEVTVSSGGAAEQAGLVSGDIIIGMGNTDIASGMELAEYFSEYSLTGESVTVRYLHDGLEYETELTPQETDVVQTGFVYNLYREKTDPVGVLKYSALEVRYWISATLQSLRMLVMGQLGLDVLSGPVGVVQVIGETYEETRDEGPLMTWLTMLNLTILLTANLGVMNLLPLPALDGGRLVFLLIEAVRGKPVNREAEAMVHFAGILLLFGLMIFVTIQDVTHLF